MSKSASAVLAARARKPETGDTSDTESVSTQANEAEIAFTMPPMIHAIVHKKYDQLGEDGNHMIRLLQTVNKKQLYYTFCETFFVNSTLATICFINDVGRRFRKLWSLLMPEVTKAYSR